MTINFVTGDAVLARRVATYSRRIDKLDINISSTPLAETDLDAYVVPVERIAWLLDGAARPRTWLPVVAYGPSRALGAAFLAGCRDYLREPWPLEELSFRLARLVDSSSFPTGWGTVRLAGSSAASQYGEVELSAGEYRILRVLLMQAGRPVPREVLYYALWGRTDKSSRVVDVHISSLRRKLRGIAAPSEAGGLVRSARGLGYIVPACRQ